MFAKIKIILIVLVIISCAILAILFLQDRTKKLEDRSYKEIYKVIVNTDKANVNVLKSEDDNVRVVIYGTNKDFVELVEGSGYVTVSKKTGNNKCFLNCKNEIDLYVPDGIVKVDVTTDIGNIEIEEAFVKNIVVNTNIGNINIGKTNTVNIKSEIGNIEIKEINPTGDSKIITDVGNVTIGTIINLKLDTKSEKGSVVIPVIKDEQEFTLKIETGVGNIDIDHHENKSE